jgi:hypothetical protein
MAGDLRPALAGLPVRPGLALAGTYSSDDLAARDAENWLFMNLGAASFPRGMTGCTG